MFYHVSLFYCLISHTAKKKIFQIATQNFPHYSLSPFSPCATHPDLGKHINIYDLLKLFNSVSRPNRCLLPHHSKPQTLCTDQQLTFSLAEAFVLVMQGDSTGKSYSFWGGNALPGLILIKLPSPSGYLCKGLLIYPGILSL